MWENDTIAAISTPLAAGGIGVIRISGPKALEVGDKIFVPISGKPLWQHKGYTCAFGYVTDGAEKLDEAVASVFRAPKSYTGEDVVELSCHGGVFLLERVLQSALRHGAVLAGPGEFTKRAFVNGKMDLTQAEAVMDLIRADSDNGVRAALAGHEGHLTQESGRLSRQLVEIAGHLAAWVDYPEEDIEDITASQLCSQVEETLHALQGLLRSYGSGRMIREGITAAIVGRPNVGKSTLMNLLARYQRSIVTDIPGTTRDVVEDSIRIGGYILRLADTAGLRETKDQVEAMGVALSRQRLESSDLVLAVFDISHGLEQEDFDLLEQLRGRTAIAVCNKSDLSQSQQFQQQLSQLKEYLPYAVVMSAKNGDGLEELERLIPQVLGLSRVDPSAAMVANERQRQCVIRAVTALEQARQAILDGVTWDAVAVCVDDAIGALMEMDGKSVSEEVVANVFARFCVGK